MSGLYNPNFSPARAASPQIRSTPDVDSQYLSELLAEHQKLGPFMQVLPVCSRLLNQDCSGSVSQLNALLCDRIRNDVQQGFGDFDRLRHRSPSPMASSNLLSNVGGTGLSGWNGLPQERLSGPPGMTMDWQGAPASPSSYTVKRILRLEIPVDTYPNFNFVGRLLGPRGNSLKRVEVTTGCRCTLEGKDQLRIQTRYSDESQDFIKRQQLRELAMLNSSFREESPGPSGSVSPFNTSGMKRAKTGR
uniref:Uncharacterized protein n=1 Tax=Salix viminalis TaxID=40686 RepID=A0A6N2KZP9_SALVM